MQQIKNFYTRHTRIISIVFFSSIVVIILFLIWQQSIQARTTVAALAQEKGSLQKQLAATEKKFTALKDEDQLKRNDALEKEIENIHTTYSTAVSAYQNLLDVKVQKIPSDTYDKEFAAVLATLSEMNYASAEATLVTLNQQMKQEQDKLAAAQAALITTSSGGSQTPATVSNTAPSNGFSKQTVHSDVGDFTVDIIAADLNSTKVIVDTASDSDCKDSCPVLSLTDYVSRNGAFAGINGTYFCPSTYPQCAGKTNSFDLLVMNKNKHYLNSDNNVYSTNPAMIFGGNWGRLVGQALEWGRDTGVDAVISNYPMLVSGGQVAYGGGTDPKMGSKGIRCFIGYSGNTVYIGIVYNATMTESAHVLHTLNILNAMNLDEGGSTALWSGGYKAGPGRNIPNAVLFVHK